MPTDAPATKDRAQYLSEPQQVVLALQSALITLWPEPQSIAGLVAHTGYSRDQVYRGLINLAHAGLAEERPTGWILTPVLTQAAERIRASVARLLSTYLGPVAP